MARRFYAPTLVSGVEDLARRRVELHVTSDERQEQRCELRWRLLDLSGRRLANGQRRVRAAPGESRQVAVLDASPWLAAHSPQELLLSLELRGGSKQAKTSLLSSNLVMLARPKEMALREPEIRTRLEARPNHGWRLHLAAGRPALFCWIEVEDVDLRASDNFFHLLPGGARSIDLQLGRRLGERELHRRLHVRSLFDTCD
jgi:beta-mannosidase